MRLYVKRLSLTFDAALGSDAPAGGSLGNFNGLAEGGATLGTLGAMLGSSMLMQRFGPRRQIICKDGDAFSILICRASVSLT